MQNGNGTIATVVSQFMCWFTAAYSFFTGLTLNDWSVIIGLAASILFGLYGAFQQRRRTRLAEERNRLLRGKINKWDQFDGD